MPENDAEEHLLGLPSLQSMFDAMGLQTAPEDPASLVFLGSKVEWQNTILTMTVCSDVLISTRFHNLIPRALLLTYIYVKGVESFLVCIPVTCHPSNPCSIRQL